MAPAARLEALLTRHWWRSRPTLAMQLLRPLACLYGALARRARRKPPEAVPVPVVVVGNLIVGGAGKTPTVIALVGALAGAGRRPGVVSRGHGRHGGGIRAVDDDASAAQVGDEPLLIRRRTGVPVWVGRDRVAAVRALCAAHPEVDVVVSDDGLQHRALPREAEVIVFDDRGVGNGLLLPAGPLREPLAPLATRQRVLYNAARPSTPLPGALAERRLGRAQPLAAWRAGHGDRAQPLATLRDRPMVAVAGIAAPERFFAMLEAAGLAIRRVALPDHHDYATLPWESGTPDVVTTEKDAVKLHPAAVGATRVWVVGLDFALPPQLIQDVLGLLGRRASR